MMSFSNNNRFNNSNNTSDPKNETVQTIPERDIALCSTNSTNHNIITPTLTSHSSTTLLSNSQKYLLNQNFQTPTTSGYQMSQFNNNNINNNNNNNNQHHQIDIPYSTQILNSNLNKLNLNNHNNQLNACYFNQQDQYLQQNHFNDYNGYNNKKHFMMQQPYGRNNYHERDDLNFTNSSTSSNLLNHNNTNNYNDMANGMTIDRLKTRILLLEQQVNQQNSILKMQNNAKNPVNLMDMKLKEVEAVAADLRADVAKENSKDVMIQKLEDLLCQREYEIEEMIKKFKNEKIEYEQEISKIKLNIQKKEEELIEVRINLTNSKKECDAYKAKNREMESYLLTLPTRDEINEAKKLVNEAKNENDRFKSQITDYEKKLLKAKHFIKEKTIEIKDLEEKLKKKDIEKECLQNEYDKFRELSKSVDELVDLRKENCKVNAELETARKLMGAHRDQINSLQSKHQEEIYKLKEQIRLENELTIALREEIDMKDKNLNELKSTVKELSNYNQCLINNNLDLNSKIGSYETIMNNDYQKLLKILCKELEICKNKLNTLVNNCICIYEGKEFNAASLIYDVGTSSVGFNDNDQLISGVLSPEYLKSTINDLKLLKDKIDELRLSVSNKFAEKLGGDCNSCSIQ